MAELQNVMPAGWDCKVDETSGRFYYINHYTKTTTWDDPRIRRKPLQGTPKHLSNVQTEHIQLQHGSPDSRRNYVYPSQTSPIPAFQMPAHMSSKTVPSQDMKPRMSPLSVKSARVQESTLTAVTDADEAVAKIAAMFPTVPETHIRILLKKYHNREALVISVLQVEKYPITTPGPFATPPPQRNIHQPLHMTPPLGLRSNSRGGSPIFRPGSGSNSTYTGSPRVGESFRSSPRPHSSPKLKLRYMKSVFPQADEMIILEILQNNENNIQKTTDALRDMGFDRTDTVKVAQQKLEAKIQERKDEDNKEEKPPAVPPRFKTTEEKGKMKADIQEKYKDVAEHLITIALESVNYDESRANQILQIMIQEDTEASAASRSGDPVVVETVDMPTTSTVADIPVSHSRQSLKSLLKAEREMEKVAYSRVIEENDGNTSYRSPNLSNTLGPSATSAKGANEKLLLEDYVNWQGPNPLLTKGCIGLAKGPDSSLLSTTTYKPRGPNKDLRKGPRLGLAKGTIFSQLESVVGDTRGK